MPVDENWVTVYDIRNAFPWIELADRDHSFRVHGRTSGGHSAVVPISGRVAVGHLLNQGASLVEPAVGMLVRRWRMCAGRRK